MIESIATISATSGTWTSPPRPTTSHSISALRSALCSAGICARLRTKIAKVFGALLVSTRRSGLFHRGAMYSAIAAASASIVSKRPTARSPLPAPMRGVSGETLRFPSDRTWLEITFAKSRIATSFLKVVKSSYISLPVEPLALGKYSPNEPIVPAEAPRQV